ncbi:MAG: DNA topoisomerase IV subunit A [Alphaproteobacteria bacterium]
MTDTLDAGDIRPTQLKDALGERYLAYALSTIVSRSLPDVRDGLKPVHRRLLFAMSQLGLAPGSGPKKAARVVGDVIGKYHPHGDQSVYDALVRLAQDFAARWPLVDGQGNFGNIDGDNPAAMRYTEARLTDVAAALLEGIDEDAVDFRETYDGEGEEPAVLPANFPNLLANGATGIAVGMATAIPPHNVGELCDALAHLLKHPKATAETLSRFVPGPDFPTGGILVEPRDSIVAAYATGRGSFRLRARWQVEELGRGTWQVVVTEIPWQVPKARLVERIAELLTAKKLPLLADVRDESAEDVRLVLEPKSRNVDAAVLMESLFRASDLETRIPLNMNVLAADRTPGVMTLAQALQAWLDHRHEVLVRRSKYRLERIGRRLEVLGGYMVVYLNLDEVIAVIREADEPKAELKRRWKLTDVQADAILDMRLRALRRIDEIAIKKEQGDLRAEKKELDALLGDEGKRRKRLGDEITALKLRFGPKTTGGARRTEVGDPPPAIEVPSEASVEREAVTVVCSAQGWVRTIKGHTVDPGDLKYKEGDRGRFVLPAETIDRLLVFSTDGRMFTVPVERLPGGRGHGESLRLMIDLANDADIVALFVHRPGRKLLLASSDGRGFVVAEDDVVAQTRAGRQVLNVSTPAEATVCVPAAGDHVAVLGGNRKLLVFALDELPEMARGRGVRLQAYAKGELVDARTFMLADGLPTRTGERTRTFTADELAEWRGKRAQAGRVVPAGFPKANRIGTDPFAG